MGASCSKRKVKTIPRVLGKDEDEEWELIDWRRVKLPAPATKLVAEFTATNPNLFRLQIVVRRVVRLLQLRKLFGKLGQYLNHNQHREPWGTTEDPQLKVLRKVWSNLGFYLRQNRKPRLFDHVERRNGRLTYKTRTQTRPTNPYV